MAIEPGNGKLERISAETEKAEQWRKEWAVYYEQALNTERPTQAEFWPGHQTHLIRCMQATMDGENQAERHGWQQAQVQQLGSLRPSCQLLLRIPSW